VHRLKSPDQEAVQSRSVGHVLATSQCWHLADSRGTVLVGRSSELLRSVRHPAVSSSGYHREHRSGCRRRYMTNLPPDSRCTLGMRTVPGWDALVTRLNR